jgi:hypothetical protein
LPLHNDAKKDEKDAEKNSNSTKRADKKLTTKSAQQQISTPKVSNWQRIDS